MIKYIKRIVNNWISRTVTGSLINNETKTIIVPEGYTLIVQGRIHIKSTDHVIIESGKGIDENGMIQGIWFNPELDSSGNPIRLDGITIQGDQHGGKHRSIK